MPRQRFTSAVRAMPGAVYSPYAVQAQREGRAVHPLHVGDTWREPFEGGRMQDLRVESLPGLHRYVDTRGIPPLIDAVVERMRARGLSCERDQVLTGAGATGQLATVAGAIVEPGEEVLILAPFWPLIRGIVQSVRGVPVEVPFYDRVHDAASALEAVRERITERSVALYVSTPSNPTGAVLPESWLAGLAELARAHDLWLLSDEVYEEFVYDGAHVSLAAMAPERSVAFHSVSKTYGMAGNRVGYCVGPAALLHEAQKLGTHLFYHAPTAGQWAALRALEGGGKWVVESRAHYREAGEAAAKALGLPPPQGSTFLFVDVSARLDARGLDGLLSDCFEAGVLVAPGRSCGEAYGEWVRLCYTAEPPAQVAAAIEKLAPILRS